MVSKAELRKRYLHKRNRLNAALRARLGDAICRRVLRHPRWRRARTVLIYVSFRSEVDTHELIRAALASGKRVIVPIIDRTNETLRLSFLKRFEDLEPTSIPGLYEPHDGAQRDARGGQVDLALAPGIVFDRSGGRIGMGGGYFDKLFGRHPKMGRIALAFSLQLVKRPLPLEPHDVGVEEIITESRVIKAPARHGPSRPRKEVR